MKKAKQIPVKVDITPPDLSLVEEAVAKTGFLLEHEVTIKLRSEGWSVINNRYYLDDVSETAREIDLIAYKAKRHAGVFYYTTLIISCKKSEENLWVFLSRDLDPDDPNAEWYPFKVWTNDEALKYQLSNVAWQPDFLLEATSSSIMNTLLEPSGDLFGSQELKKTKYSVQDDKNIFAAISSLMKAQAYEMNTLHRRRKENALYSFHLISVVDTDFVELRFNESGRKAALNNQSRWVFNYLINKESTCSRIHFITARYLDAILPSYTKLHNINKLFFKGLYSQFYDDIFTDPQRVNVFRDAFIARVARAYRAAVRTVNPDFQVLAIGFVWDPSSEVLAVDACSSSDECDALTGSKHARSVTKQALRDLYQYSGKFEFVFSDLF